MKRKEVRYLLAEKTKQETETIREKVNPIVRQTVDASRVAGLTLKEFHILSQLISWEYEKAKKEKEKKLLNEMF